MTRGTPRSRQDSQDSETLFAEAFACHERGNIPAARILYRSILAHDPRHPEALHLLGLITAQSGDPATGARMIEAAIAVCPGKAPHRNSLALAYRLAGRREDAIAAYRAALDLRPESAELHNNLAAVLAEAGQTGDAVAHYRRAAALAPGIADIWCNLASTLEHLGAWADVEACFLRALAVRPDHAAAHAGLGRWLIARSRHAEAEPHLTASIRLAPTPAALTNLGIARQHLGRAAEAEASYRAAAAADPGCADAWYNLGCLLSAQGRTDEATECHERALTADPLHGPARLAACVAHLPVVYASDAEIETRRENYLSGLEALSRATADPAVARAVAGAIGASQPFFLPYQGENDVGPQGIYGRMACRLLSRALPAVRLARRPAAGERIRVGVVSGFFRDHTVFRLFLEGWLTGLDRRRFEIVGFHTGAISDAETARAAGWCDRFVADETEKMAWRAAIADATPHVLLYPEIGMDPVAGWLAAQRLAPVQCVAWGQPVTSGMPTTDYFLSADAMEPPDGEMHYSEALIRLPGIGIDYRPHAAPYPPATRESLGLAGSVPVYWSGQALYKYHPRYDTVFPRIAAAVGACQFVFIGFAPSEAVTRMFWDRLVSAFAGAGLDAARHCVLLPPMSQDRFMAAVAAADVILDTPGWSGGRSTLDCLAADPAIVTLPGPLMRGRHTAAILREIECDATIAASLEEYVAIAARLVRDPAWRGQVRRDVAARKQAVFQQTAPIRALEVFLASAAAAI